MKNLNKPLVTAIALAAAILFFTLNSCKKDLLVGSSKPAETSKPGQNNLSARTNYHRHYGREFASLDSSVRDSEVVITPNGPRLKSDVHLIPEGHKLKYSGARLQEVEISTGKLINDFGVPGPLKYIKPNLRNSANTSTKTPHNIINPIPGPATWTTWAQTTTVSGGLANGNAAIWTVPSLPTVTTDGQILFIFDALEDAGGNSILQPILQFGQTYAGGSNTSWSISTAFQPNPNSIFIYGPYYQVSVGALLNASITLSGTQINCSLADNHGHVSNLPTETASYTFTTLFATLEQYNVIRATDYPPDQYVTVQLNRAQNLVPEINSTPAPLFGEHTDVPSGGATYAYLYFHPETIPTISYSSPVGFTVNTAITPSTPTVTGVGPTTTFSVSPALPAGLTLNSSTGVITGTPTVVTQPNSNTYTVTATNTAGSGHTNIVIEIWAAPVLSASYGGHPGYVVFTAIPNIPSPGTGNLFGKDLNTGQTGSSANSPYGQTNSFTVGHTYQFYMVEYGLNPPGPSPATSNTVQYTVF